MPLVTFNTDTLPWGSDFHLTEIPKRELPAFTDRLREVCAKYPQAPFGHAGDIGWQGALHLPYVLLDAEINEFETKVLKCNGNHCKLPSDVSATDNYFRQTDRFLDAHGKIIELNASTCLIGEDGYPDFRTAGASVEENATTRNTARTSFPEFYTGNPQTWPSTFGIGRLMRKKADEATDRIIQNLKVAFDTYNCAVLMTHYPPFLEAAFHKGKMGTPVQCSAIVNQRLGEELVTLMQQPLFRDKSLMVICGHTHEEFFLPVLDNLQVFVGEGNRASHGTWISPPKVHVLRLPG